MDQPQDFEAARERLLGDLATAWRDSGDVERGKVLTVLYQEYTKRYLSDNNRIWTTAANMVPLSLAAFVLLASIERPTLGQIVAFRFRRSLRRG